MPGFWRVGVTVATSLALGLGGGHSPAHAASDNTVVVFDASNSMNSRFEKSQRIREAKQALIDAARRTGVNPGLVVFGSRQVQSCGDVATLVPVNANNPAQMAAALAGVRAMGVSSLAAAMGAAAAEVSSQGQPAKMLVIADGAGVKSCRVDTCTFATELKSQNPNLSISVVAVSPKPQEVPSLRCISQATGGNYFEVRTTRGLRSAMVQALAAPLVATAAAATAISTVPAPRRKPPVPVAAANIPSPRPKPADLTALPLDADTAANTTAGFNTTVFAPSASGGQQIAVIPAPAPQTEGTQAPSAPAPTAPVSTAQPGNTTVLAPSARTQPAAPATPAVTVAPVAPVAPSAPATTTLVKRIPPTATPAAPAVPTAPTVAQAGVPNAPPRTTILVKRSPAGAQGPSTSKQTVATPSAQPAAATGAIKLQAFVIENSKPIPAGLLWQVYRTNPDSSRGQLVVRSSDPAPELKVPTGNYEVVAIFGQASNAAKVTVAKGKTATGSVVLNAGGLQLIPLAGGTALTDDAISNAIYRSDDPRNPIVANAASGSVIYLNAGIYKIVSRYGSVNAVARADVVVQSGKLTQAKINHRASPAEFRLTDKAGGAAMKGTTWEIVDANGQVLKRSAEATPRYILAEGEYSVAATQGGKTYRSKFSVISGQPAKVEVLTN